jgi:hypothetical protein
MTYRFCSVEPLAVALRFSVGQSTCLRSGRDDMLDVLYLGLVIGFLVVSWGLVELCDRLNLALDSAPRGAQ